MVRTDRYNVDLFVHRQSPSSYDLNRLLHKFNVDCYERYDHNIVKRKVITYSDLVQFMIVCDVSPYLVRLVRERCISFYGANCDYAHANIVISFHVKYNHVRVYVDRYWNACILKLVLFQMELEDSLSWLSTLGGAFSSYGEFNMHYAQKAQRVSFNQLKLAKIHGDPNLISRALIYICYAGCQQSYKRLVKRFVRRVVQPYISSISSEYRDKIVEQMYYGLCYRIKHFY